jgi:hypothetical protein
MSTERKFYDLLHTKECWLWCWLAWNDTEELCIERIGGSNEDVLREYMDIDLDLAGTTILKPPKKLSDMSLSSALREVEELERKRTMEELVRGHLGIPEWLDYEMSNEGMAGIMEYCLDYHWQDDMPTWVRFGMEHGIAPFQPFLLKLPMPHYSGPDYYGEYDVEYDYDIMHIVPQPIEETLMQWELCLKAFYVCPPSL